MNDTIDHCVEKIVELLNSGKNDRRTILQIGYNLGRMSELTKQGREPYWDRWKGPVDTWDVPRLQELARDLADSLHRHPSECVPDTPYSA